jgi:tRNA nucleotidyltransferase (CCA-adding enzyme)
VLYTTGRYFYPKGRNAMQIYRVGGAVRDQLLQFPYSERDWVVVGATEAEMLAQGYRPVGKDFPVFLHPESQEEYALARTERKTAPGYKGFVVHAAPDVSLEDDLLRRDLTINAMAMDGEGRLIDPYGGQADLQQRLLRHVSPAFSEDPVRILRIARFAARYAHLGFSVAEDTLRVMQTMVAAGEVDHLVPERVWAELHKALHEATPTAFFEVLQQCGALSVIFPELAALFGVPQPPQHHPEIDTGLHSLLCLQQACTLSERAEVRLAALLHDLGKGITPPQHWPSHHGHEKKGLPLLKKLCKRLRVPNRFASLAMLVMEYHTHCHRALELRADTVMELLQTLGVFKPGSHLAAFLLACEADARGRTGFETRPYPQADYLNGAAQAALAVDTAALTTSGLSGPALGAAIKQGRITAVQQYKTAYAAVTPQP